MGVFISDHHVSGERFFLLSSSQIYFSSSLANRARHPLSPLAAPRPRLPRFPTLLSFKGRLRKPSGLRPPTPPPGRPPGGLQAKNERTKSESVMTYRSKFSNWGGHFQRTFGGGRRHDLPASASGGNRALSLLSKKTRLVDLFYQTLWPQVERTRRNDPDAGQEEPGCRAGALCSRFCALDRGSPAGSWLVPDSSKNGPSRPGQATAEEG